MIETPYLLFLGDAPDALAAKVAQGIRDWRPEAAIGQFRMQGCRADMGLPDMSVAEAAAAGVRTLVVGVANRGGVIAPAWLGVLKRGAGGRDRPRLGAAHPACATSPSWWRWRWRTGAGCTTCGCPSSAIRSPTAGGGRAKRLLAMGTDCSVGKMYTALAMEREMRARGMAATFRATGQTGILITGGGVPLDAVVADFMAGAIEWLTPDNDAGHWDLIEGQGSLFHPSYSGVTLALVHGGQPDAIVLCHEPTRAHMRGLPGYALPTLEALRELSLDDGADREPGGRHGRGVDQHRRAAGRRTALDYLAEVEARMGLPAVDPFRQGAGRLVDALA